MNLLFLIFTIITYCFKNNLLIDFIMLLNANYRIKDHLFFGISLEILLCYL